MTKFDELLLAAFNAGIDYADNGSEAQDFIEWREDLAW